MKRLLIGGTNSGCGKTTITCALLAALMARNINVASFKCGPDYIDPMFHRSVLGAPAYNLDPFFLDGNGLRLHLAAHAEELSIIEGAMGFYDGIATTDEASAYTVARETDTPVVLVISARGAGASLGATIKGFMQHKPDSHIKGVIFNDASESRNADLQKIASHAGVQIYGSMPRNEAWSIPNRHLGLMTAGEIEDLQYKLHLLKEQARRSLDIDALLALAGTAPDLGRIQMPQARRMGCVRLAVAKDEAFCFLYEENLELLQALGCELVFFSPLRDNALPSNVNGLYLCGGYPELHAKALSDNASMRKSVRRAVKRGMPTIAECGGFLYIHDKLDGLPMCGAICGAAYETKKLQRFGYITLTANQDNLLCRANESIRAREFHYWDSDTPGGSFTAHKAGRRLSYTCVHATDTLYAGFAHLYFPANPSFAKRFVERMKEYAP